MNKIKIIVLLFLLSLNLQAVELSPHEIMWNVINKYRVNDEYQEMKMTLVNKDGKEWERTATFYIKKIDEDNDKALFRFHSPADLEGSGVLTIENKQKEDDQWIYVPAYHTARRIASSNRSEQYMGTDFYYEDVIRIRVDEYEYKILGKEKIENIEYLIIEGIPISERLIKESGYNKIISWVDPQKFVIKKQDFYSKKDNVLIKALLNSELKDNNGILRWTKREMTTLATGHKTVAEYIKLEFNKGISDKYFTVRYLKREK